MKPTLVIANKAYSSWSFRPWVSMRHFGIAFDVIPLAQENTRAEMLRYSPAGKCPSLHDGEIVVWDSLRDYRICRRTPSTYTYLPRGRGRRARKPVGSPPKCIRASWPCAGCCR